MGKYRKDFNTTEGDSDYESPSHFKAPKFRDSDNYEQGWKNNKKKSKQFRQARKKRTISW